MSSSILAINVSMVSLPTFTAIRADSPFAVTTCTNVCTFSARKILALGWFDTHDQGRGVIIIMVLCFIVLLRLKLIGATI
jgi:hypothetical protein